MSKKSYIIVTILLTLILSSCSNDRSKLISDSEFLKMITSLNITINYNDNKTEVLNISNNGDISVIDDISDIPDNREDLKKLYTEGSTTSDFLGYFTQERYESMTSIQKSSLDIQ